MSDMELMKYVRPGDRVDLYHLEEAFDFELTGEEEVVKDKRNFYITKVYDITEEDRFEIFMPLDKTKIQLLPVGERYEVYFYGQKGIYTCKAEIVERYKNENAAVAILELRSQITKHQRREYYRYSTIIGMAGYMLTDEEEMQYLEHKNLVYDIEPQDKCVIVDISGGGMRFVSAAKYELNHLVQCKFILRVKEENQTFECVVRILGKKPVANNPINTEYRGQFLFMSSYDREQIIRFIFEEERKLRQRK